MFETLDEQIKLDEQKASSKRERTLEWATIGFVSIAVFVGLYLGIYGMQ